jgi:VIT1/CCC1 family predicted Fe2+/Mn2+ transporter
MKPFISTITALALAGCVSTAGPVAPISVLPDQLQSAITATCGVVLTAQSLSTVLSLVGGGGLSGKASRAAGPGGVVAGTFQGHPIVGKRVR